jgi:hypothetical protein
VSRDVEAAMTGVSRGTELIARNPAPAVGVGVRFY